MNLRISDLAVWIIFCFDSRVLRGKYILAVSMLAMVLGLPVEAAEKLPAHPKLVYRQIGGGYSLALELGRQPQTFFLCGPSETDCISTTQIGWRKPFIIYRSGATLTRNYNVIDTTGMKHRESAKYLETVRRYPAAVAWKTLSPTRRLW